MKPVVLMMISIFCLTGIQCSPEPYARKVEDNKIHRVVAGIMDEKPVKKPVPGQEEILKEYETFLDQVDFKSAQQTEALHQLGNLLMAMEKEELEKNPRLLNKPEAHRFSAGVYEKILAQFPSHRENDEILYQLAHGYSEENNKDKAVLLLKDLVKQYPKSSYYSESMFRIGEYYFEEAKYPEASEAYFKALQSSSNRALMEAITYKISWTAFKMGDYQKTVDHVVNSLNRYTVSRNGGVSALDIETLSEFNWAQVKELLHLAVLSFDFSGGVGKARNYFDFHGHVSYENLIYRPLGYLYLNRGKFPEAVQAFETFLALYPAHEEAPGFQIDLIETWRKAEKWSLASQARAAFIENYKPGSLWWKNNTPNTQAKIGLFRKNLLFQQAQDLHAAAQRSKKREDYLTAIQSYQAFLKEFSKEREAPRIQFFLGEAFFETGQFEQAAAEYEIAAYQYPLYDYSEPAGVAALISYEKIATGTREPGPVFGSTDPQVGTALTLSFYNSCLAFLKTFPESGRRFDVAYKAMLLAMQSGNKKDGRLFARQIIDAPLEKTSVKVIARTRFELGKSYFDDKEYDRAEVELKQALAWNAGAGGQDGPKPDEIKLLLASIQFKKAEMLKNNLKWSDAGNAFLNIYQEFPENEIAPISLMNAGGAFLEIKDLDSALHAFQTVSRQYGHSPYTLEARMALLAIYEKQNKTGEAIVEYEFLIQNTVDPAKKRQYSDRLFSLYFNSKNWIKLYQLLGAELKTGADRNPKWAFYYAMASKELKNDQEALWAADRNLSDFHSKPAHDPEEEEWMMKSALLKGELLAKQFGDIQLSHPLQKTLPVKKEKLKEAVDTLTLAARSEDAGISTEALFGIGNLFEQFANDLAHSERPKEMNGDQSLIYEELLQKQIDPLFHKAIEIYQKNVSLKNHADNEWIKKSEERINQLQNNKKG
ncbi:MAG: tetratricopeptide repeat protein [Nitrospirae bacterium]|nr:tetratricopeptide repeat protein [Nitrospirota bacterium]